jgi:nicotinate-nucleotide pyrophosphorylase (carboxylating)
MWKAVLLEMVADDVGNGDVTSNSLIPRDAEVSAEIIAHRPGIAAGITEACWLFETFGISATPKVRDGSRFSASTPLISLRGNARKIFAIERTALNILGRLCGIATATAHSAAILRRARSTAKIAATRKTILPHI